MVCAVAQSLPLLGHRRKRIARAAGSSPRTVWAILSPMAHQARVFGTLRAMLPSILAAIVLSIAGLVAVRSLVPADVLRETNDVAGNYLQTVGTIYAVLLAFVVFVVWQQFNDAR